MIDQPLLTQGAVRKTPVVIPGAQPKIVKRSMKTLLRRLMKKDVDSGAEVTEVVYSIDSMSSVIAAYYIKRLIEDARSLQDREKHPLIFTEVDHFAPKLGTTRYIWLDLPKLNVAFSKEIGYAFNKAEHINISETTAWSPGSALHAGISGAVNHGELPLQPVYTAVEYDKDRRRIDRHYPAEISLYCGIVMRAIAVMGDIAPFRMVFSSMESTAGQSVIWALSQADRLCGNFYSKKTSEADILRAYVLMDQALAALGHEADHSGLAANNKALKEMYKQRVKKTREAIALQLTRQNVIISSGGKKDERTVSVWITRMHQDFWLAKRLMMLSFNYVHNSRRVDYGIHVTTNLPRGHRGTSLRNVTTSTSPV